MVWVQTPGLNFGLSQNREARNIYAAQQYVAPLSTSMLSSAIAQASSQFASQFLSAAAPSGANAAGNITALNAALTGKALSYPFWYSEFNLGPYDQLAVSLPLFEVPTLHCLSVSS